VNWLQVSRVYNPRLSFLSLPSRTFKLTSSFFFALSDTSFHLSRETLLCVFVRWK